MGYNAQVELNGNLGADAKLVEKDGKTFAVLSIATKDSYPVKEGATTTWKDSNTTLWHSVLIFRPKAVTAAQSLKMGDRVDIKGSLSYRAFKGEDGYTHQEATIIGRYVEKVEFNTSDEPSDEMLSEASEELPQAA